VEKLLLAALASGLGPLQALPRIGPMGQKVYTQQRFAVVRGSETRVVAPPCIHRISCPGNKRADRHYFVLVMESAWGWTTCYCCASFPGLSSNLDRWRKSKSIPF